MPPARPSHLADSLVSPLRAGGRAPARVDADDFLRPASLRWERGRFDPDALYEDALGVGGLLREVLVPLGSGGSGRYLPTLWDATRDRATRAAYVVASERTVLLLSGAFLLQPALRWEFSLTVHLALSPAARARRVGAAEAWTLPAYERYDREVEPGEVADVVVRVDDPRHPALITS